MLYDVLKVFRFGRSHMSALTAPGPTGSHEVRAAGATPAGPAAVAGSVVHAVHAVVAVPSLHAVHAVGAAFDLPAALPAAGRAPQRLVEHVQSD